MTQLPPLGPFHPSRRLDRWAAKQADETRARRWTLIALRFIGLVSCPHPVGQRVQRRAYSEGGTPPPNIEVCLLCRRTVELWKDLDLLSPSSAG